MWKHFGTEDDRVELTEYNPEWRRSSRRSRAHPRRLRAALRLSSIGSTALPGIAAKPILDLMLGVARLEDADELVAPMCALGYEYAGRYEVFGRFSFVLRVHGRRVSHAHGFAVDGATGRRLFFAILRAHPEPPLRRLKRRLAAATKATATPTARARHPSFDRSSTGA
jgi:GrpB-like predicted nucleotidyltransferase (UPF0157 family)